MTTEEQANPTAYPLPEETPTKPAHYNSTFISPLQVIDDWELGFRLGNAIKYIARHRKKGNPVGDFEKAVAYLNMEIERFKSGRTGK